MRFDTKAFVLSVLSLLGLGIVLYFGSLLFYTFIKPLIWAGLFSFLLWPAHKLLLRFVRFPSISAFLLVTLIFGVAVTFLVPTSVKLAQETANLLDFLSDRDKVVSYAESLLRNDFVSRLIPENVRYNLEKEIELNAERLATFSRDALLDQLSGFGKSFLSISTSFLFFLLFTFFILKDAPSVVNEISLGLRFLSGTRFEELWNALRDSLKAALVGGLITATIQGSLAGIGYYIFGAPYPLIFTILTIIAGTIPFTPPVVFTPVALYVMFVEDFTNGLFLMIYSWTVVNLSDPIIRPILVGRGIKMPTGLMFIGVLGGVANFGLMGIFVGPVIMAILRVFWLELFRNE